MVTFKQGWNWMTQKQFKNLYNLFKIQVSKKNHFNSPWLVHIWHLQMPTSGPDWANCHWSMETDIKLRLATKKVKNIFMNIKIVLYLIY